MHRKLFFALLAVVLAIGVSASVTMHLVSSGDDSTDVRPAQAHLEVTNEPEQTSGPLRREPPRRGFHESAGNFRVSKHTDKQGGEDLVTFIRTEIIEIKDGKALVESRRFDEEWNEVVNEYSPRVRHHEIRKWGPTAENPEHVWEYLRINGVEYRCRVVTAPDTGHRWWLWRDITLRSEMSDSVFETVELSVAE